MEKKFDLLKVIRIVVVIVLLAIVVYEAMMIYRDQKEYKTADNEYESISNKYVRDAGVKKAEETADDANSDDNNADITYPDLEINFEELKSVNSDFIGWLYFPAVDVSYPVVRENEINQYLYTTFEGKSNKAGSIYMDVLSYSDFTGYSDMLFGHNMKNGSMFGSLKKIYQSKDEDILADNPYIYVYTEDGVRIYRVFAYYITTDGSYSYTEVTNEKEYEDYISYIKKNSIYTFPEDVSFDGCPSLLTLSTCQGQSGSGKRFVVHSVFLKKA
ncbi:MAG: class B sortase [Butyrivibrio sp.]|nr:class B sortase [Butyrivibrio sp.]